MDNQTKHTYQCSAPAKLILSGEHSVLYHCPALSIALPIFSHCHSSFQIQDSLTLNIELSDFSLHENFSEIELFKCFESIETRYRSYLKNELPISQVLRSPLELIICCVGLFHKHYRLQDGDWHLKVHSEIPVGRGLGSSASVILSVLHALMQQMKLDLSQAEILNLAQMIESRQHGKSSGLDPATILNGGLISYHLDHGIESKPHQNLQGWLIDTGEPLSSTGEAVSAVRERFADNQPLWDSFRAVSETLLANINQGSNQSFMQMIDRNEELLEQIGVVPSRLAIFIRQLKAQYQAHAKICGSGAVKGEQGGIILCFCDQAPQELCQEHGYTWQAFTIESLGVRCHATES